MSNSSSSNLVLRHAHAHIPELCGNLGNIALLGIAAKLGPIDTALATGLATSYRVFADTSTG